MRLKPGLEADWKKYVEVNQDPYGKAVVDYEIRWAEAMEAEIDKSGVSAITEHAERLSHEADTEGITGFMYNCAVAHLFLVWVYGEELRKWHNGLVGYEGDGVVNTCVLTVGE